MNKAIFYNSREKVFLGILFFAALVSLFFFIAFRTLAFPEHTITFAISREQAAEKAKAFVSQQHIDVKGFKETTVFGIDEMTKTYLEREVGVTQTARLAANDVAVWHFTTRLFKPLEQEEMSVVFLPNGRLVSFAHEIAETKKGVRLDKSAAQKKAEAFLRTTAKIELAEWKLVNSETKQQKARVDHVFTWEKEKFRAQDATYRTEVHVLGDQIGAYSEYLKIPEDWTRAYYKETSNNDLAQTIAESAMVLIFGLAMVITFILEYRRNNLRTVSLRAVAWVAALIALLTALNSLPLTLSMYETTVSWEAFIGSIVLISLLGGMFEGSTVLLILAAGEAKFRSMYPQKLSVGSLYRHALFTKSVNKALLVGTCVGIIFFTYELLYYFLGNAVGFWAPAAINYSDIYSTVLPWIYPMFVGFLAAASEEGIFRLFGIPFLKKYVKKTWIAIFITAVVWGFLHSNYPQSPWFVRGIEISLMGLVLGWLFVRYGFLATFTAHYTFNALQTAISFYQSGNFYASVSSTIVSLLPFLLGLWLLGVALYKKGFAPERKEDLNAYVQAETLPETTEQTDIVTKAYGSLSPKKKRILLGLSLVSTVVFVLISSQTSINQIPTSIGRGEVQKIAQETLAKRSISTTDYKSVITFSSNDIATQEEYILEVEDYQTLRTVYPEKLPLAYWTVRYLKPLQKESFEVTILPNGKVFQVIHELDETAPSANLTPEQAKKRADDYLLQEKGYNLQAYKLVENKAEKKEKRTDYLFVYEEKNNKIGDAVFLTEVAVVGKEVSGFNTYLKVPEAWIRKKEETTTFDFIIGGLIGIIAVALAWVGFKTFFDFLREKKLNFRVAFKISAAVVVISLIVTLNSLSIFYSNYTTTIPLQTYIIQSLLASVLGFVMSFLITATFIAVFITFWKEQIGKLLPDKNERARYVQDAVIAGYSVPLILIGISSVLMYLLVTNNWLRSVATFETFPQLDVFLPLVASLGEIPMAVGSISVFGIVLLLLKKTLTTWKKVIVALSFIAILAALPQQETIEDSITSVLQNMLILLVGAIISVHVLRKNLLAYGLTIIVSTLLTSGWALFMQPDLFFKINGLVLLLFSVLPAVLYFFPKLLLELKFGRMVQ